MQGKCTHTRLSFLGFINVQLQVYNIVFYYNSIHPTQGCMGAGEAGYNLDSNVFQSQTHTMHAYTYTYCQFRNINSSNMHAIGLLEKGKVPTGKICL